MGAYSEIELDEINEILNHYDFSEAVEFVPTVTGISNSNFKVTLKSGQVILLKISNDKTIEQLENEQQVLSVLEKYNFPYSLHPFKTIQGKPIYRHRGMHGVVFPFVQGLPPVINENVCEQIGQALAKLHCLQIPTKDLDSIRSYSVVGHGGVSISEYCERPGAPSDFVETFNKLFPNKLKDIPYGEFSVGIIHGDLYFDNSLFYDDKLVTLIDFEQSGRGRHILDLGIALSGSCLSSTRDNLDLNLIRAFLKGYRSLYKLSKLEREYLKTAILVGFFSISLWRIKRFYEGNLDERKRYNYRELLARAVAFDKSFKLQDLI